MGAFDVWLLLSTPYLSLYNKTHYKFITVKNTIILFTSLDLSV